MKLATYLADGLPRTGIVVGDKLVDTGLDGTMIDLIARWDELKSASEAKLRRGAAMPLAEAKLCAPVLRPGKIFAIGLNYADHIAESRKWRRRRGRCGSPRRRPPSTVRSIRS